MYVYRELKFTNLYNMELSSSEIKILTFRGIYPV
jgi:hypothetical protein